MNMVFFWMQFNGNKVDATGAASVPFELTSIQVVKFNDGKAVEHWEYFDPENVPGAYIDEDRLQ